MLYKDLTDKIIECFYTVYNRLGYGFLEKVYENAMMIELREMGLKAENQKQINVKYKGFEVGNYFADIVVEDKVILEMKAAERLVAKNEFQLINYLKATEFEVGLLLNFGFKPEFKRKLFTNDRK